MNTINTYIGNNPPKNSNTIWLRPLKQGGVGFYVWVNDKWNTIKLMDTKGSRTPMDDTPIDIDGDSDHYYTKDLIDDKFADILGLDAEGIDALKALVEDGDAMTGLLTAVNNKYDKVDGVQLSSKSGDIAPIPFIKVDYGDGIEGSVELSSGLLKFNGGTGEGSYNLHASFVAETDSTTGKTNPAGIHYQKNGDGTFDDTTLARQCDITSVKQELENHFDYEDRKIQKRLYKKVFDVNDYIEDGVAKNGAIWRNYDTSAGYFIIGLPEDYYIRTGDATNNSAVLGGCYKYSYYTPTIKSGGRFFLGSSSGSYVYIVKDDISTLHVNKDCIFHIQGIVDKSINVANSETVNKHYIYYNDAIVKRLANTDEFDLYLDCKAGDTVGTSGQVAFDVFEVYDESIPIFADVAYSGSYTDLADKPTIPAALVNSDWNASSGVAEILNKPTIPEISTDIAADDTSDTKTASPKAVKTFVEGKGYTTNTGTITGITMNGTSKGTSGAVDLGTVITGVKVGSTSLTPSSGVVTISTSTSPTSGSSGLITSGGVYTALQGYETKLTFTTISSTSLSASRNTYYRFTNTPSSLSITLPTSSLAGGVQCAFCFTTSSSFSSFTISGGTVKKQNGFTIAASKIYEVVALYDGAKWLVTATEFE